jgi:hypothetical protein
MNASQAPCNCSLQSLITLLLVHMQERQMAAGGPDGHCLGHYCVYIYFFKLKKKKVAKYAVLNVVGLTYVR